MYGKRANQSADAVAGFNTAKSSALVGVTFGGGCFAGHGVGTIGGKAEFRLIEIYRRGARSESARWVGRADSGASRSESGDRFALTSRSRSLEDPILLFATSVLPAGTGSHKGRVRRYEGPVMVTDDLLAQVLRLPSS